MSIKALEDLLTSNPDVLTKVKRAATHLEIAKIAKDNGVNVTTTEVLKFTAKTIEELDDDELEAVAGGEWGDRGEKEVTNKVSNGSSIVEFGETVVGREIAVGIAIK